VVHTRDMGAAANNQTRVSLVVPVKPGRIFDLLATPYRLPDIDPSGRTVSDDNASPVTAEGQVYTMNMVRLDGPETVRYQNEHRVTSFRHNRVIGWQVAPVGGDPRGWSWRFDLTPLDGKRTEVTLTYDWSEISPENLTLFAMPDRDAADLEACLTQLAIEVKK